MQPNRIAWFLGSLILGGSLLLGCVPNLLVKTVPTDSNVIVKDSGGKLIKSGPAPLETSVSMTDPKDRYTIEVFPSTAHQDAYLPKTKELTKPEFDKLPGDRLKQIEIALDRKEFRLILDIQILLDEVWMGVGAPSRAYLDVSEVGGSVPQRMVEFGQNLGVTGLALSPEGSMLVYSVATYEPSQLKRIQELKLERAIELPILGANIHGVNLHGGGIQHITREDFQDMYPFFTFDGKNLLFSTNRRRPRSMDILRINSSGRGGIMNIYLDQRNNRAVKPTQARNGTITFALYPERWSKPDDVEIWTVGGPNQFPTQITRGVEPAISPDGSKIAYVGPDGNLWMINVDGTEATQLTSGAAEILKNLKNSLSGEELEVFKAREKAGRVLRYYRPFSHPSWSPDSRRIVFTSMQGNDRTGRPNEDIWLLDLDTGGMEQLTTNGSTDRFPVASPDGKWIYFLSNRGVRWAIWRIPMSSK